MNPHVAVVLPAYNSAETIERSIRSILEQSFENLELIVVDDGSTDDTTELVSRIQDSRMRLFTQPHRGVAEAANFGVRQTRCPLIARMDADDVSDRCRLARQVEWLERECLDVVGCQVRMVNREGVSVASLARYQRWINEQTLTHEQIVSLRFVELPIVNPTILARREYFELEFAANDLPEDYDLMLRAAAAGMRFGKVRQVLFDWIDHSSRVTRTDPRYSTEAFARCRQHHLLAGPLSARKQVDLEIAGQQVDLWGVGQTGKPWLRWLQAEGIQIRQAYEVNRRKVGAVIHGVPIHHTSNLSTADGTPLIIAVGADRARDQITPQLLAQGYRLGEDAWFVA